MSTSKICTHSSSPLPLIGYRTPEEACQAPREIVIFVTCPNASGHGQDLLACIDVDPESSSYCKVSDLLIFNEL